MWCVVREFRGAGGCYDATLLQDTRAGPAHGAVPVRAAARMADAVLAVYRDDPWSM